MSSRGESIGCFDENWLEKKGRETGEERQIRTTHHPYLVDHFSDMTDRVWIFDSDNGETKIKNLEREVIQPTNEKLKADDIEPIDYSSSLGEHWSLGFLGGVPKHVA